MSLKKHAAYIIHCAVFSVDNNFTSEQEQKTRFEEEPQCFDDSYTVPYQGPQFCLLGTLSIQYPTITGEDIEHIRVYLTVLYVKTIFFAIFSVSKRYIQFLK